MTEREKIIQEIFRNNCVDFAGNYEVTPGNAMAIARKIIALSGTKEMMIALCELARIDAATNSVNHVKEVANRGLDAVLLAPQ
jgi:hypothetical protein